MLNKLHEARYISSRSRFTAANVTRVIMTTALVTTTTAISLAQTIVSQSPEISTSANQVPTTLNSGAGSIESRSSKASSDDKQAAPGLDTANRSPHVVLILADDLGYGDIQPLNSSSSIPTPNFNRLARQGLSFTDAHTPSSVCTPTRYGLLTGRYCWRTSLKSGVLNGYGEPLIDADRFTLARLMKSAGYRTNVIGKWHLGLGFKRVDSEIDLSQPLEFHPGHVGFDHSLVIPASLDFPPYVYFEDGLATNHELEDQSAVPFPAFTRQGPRAIDFEPRNCLDHLTDKTLEIIRDMKNHDAPTFIYFPLTAPHKPVLPNALFSGSSEFGPYGDFIRQVDHTIGRVIETLEQQKQLDNTILIVTSDNGSFMKRIPTDSTDHIMDSSVQGYHLENHKANGSWRGTKADIWEAGHRVPFFVRLPNKRHAGSRITQVIGLIDIMATLADFLEVQIPETTAQDSYSFANLLRSPNHIHQRPPLICHSSAGMFAIRSGPWKLIAGNGSGGREQPKGNAFEEPWILVNLETDPTESKNVAEAHPEIFVQLKSQLLEIKGND